MFAITILLLLLAAPLKAYFLLEEECLNYTVYPVQYELTIIPYIYNQQTSYYDCDIVITVIANAPNVNIIELDAKDLEIKEGSIKVFNGNIDIVNKHRPYEYNKKAGKLYIYLMEPLKQYSVYKTQYQIRISVIKYVNPNSKGIFVVKYEDGGPKYMYTTRLSPNQAKYFFPCFDNPKFEAIFKFRVYMAPQRPGLQYANTSLVISKEQHQQRYADNYLVIDYIPSPQVALHQVGFHYSTFESLKTTAKKTNDTLIVWAPTNIIKECNFILLFGGAIIDLIHEYASVNRPLLYGPINLVAVPTLLNGYEDSSWNLLTNGYNRVVYDAYFTSIQQLEKMTFELSQQLSRIWLGNPGELDRTRWKEEWFKEGMATYLAYYFLAQYNNGGTESKHRWPMGIYGLRMRHKAMEVDWHRSTPALAVFNRTLAIEIPEMYRDLVAYKTASILWMVENWLGSEKFHQALVKYINTRRGTHISLHDFTTNLDLDTVECLNQFFNGSTASSVLNSWFHKHGYPVINVEVLRDRTPNAVQLKQHQFSFVEEKNIESEYLIPISYIVQNGENCYNCYQPRFTIGRHTYTFGENLNNGWIILNRNASGYYRVNYDVTTWSLIAKTLKENPLAIDELNRAQIVNDVFALYVAGQLDLALALDILDYLNNEKSPIVWESVIYGYELLKIEGANCRMTRTLYEEWQEFMRRKVSDIYKYITSDIQQHPTTRLFRSNIVELACSVHYKPCLNNLHRMYTAYRQGRQKLNPDFRQECYYVIHNETTINRIDRFNIFEQEDLRNANHRMEVDKRFFYMIPTGSPSALPMQSPSTPLPFELTTPAMMSTTEKGRAGAFIPSLYIIANAILIIAFIR